MPDMKAYEAMAKLDLPEEERRWVADRADGLIASFQALESLDTEKTEPLITVLELRNVLREDVCVRVVTREELLANAPDQYDGCFRVPKTLD